MSASIVTKLEAANRQLCTAIRLFFDDGDAVAVHTLVCSAREIYEKHCAKNNSLRMFDFVRAGSPDAAEKDLWNLLNAARNFFKHPGDTLGDIIEFDDTMNDFQLLTACQDCATVSAGRQPPEVQAYALWYLAVEAPDEQAVAEAAPGDAAAAQALQHQIDQQFPGLRTAPRAEKKRFGRRLLEDAGKLVERTEARPGDVQIGPDLYVGFA
jgi:hypothetical protein